MTWHNMWSKWVTIYRVIQIKLNQFKKMSIWSDQWLTNKALSQWQTFSGVFTYKTAAKTTGIDMEHCHPMYKFISSDYRSICNFVNVYKMRYRVHVYTCRRAHLYRVPSRVVQNSVVDSSCVFRLRWIMHAETGPMLSSLHVCHGHNASGRCDPQLMTGLS